MLKIAVLVSGGGTNLQAIIDNIESGNIKAEIAAVVSNNPNSFALERAKKHGINHTVLRKKDFDGPEAYDDALIAYIKEREIGLVILAGFMVILGNRFIRAFENKMINIHPSLIPAFCGEGFYGIRVHEAVLERGAKVTGATVHFVNEITDGGPIILQRAVEVIDGDTPEALQKRVMEQAEWKILSEAIRLYSENRLHIENNIVRRVMQ